MPFTPLLLSKLSLLQNTHPKHPSEENFGSTTIEQMSGARKSSTRSSSTSSSTSSLTSDRLFSSGIASTMAHSTTHSSPLPKEIYLFPDAHEEPYCEKDQEDNDRSQYLIVWPVDPNASEISLDSISSSVLSFLALETPPCTPIDGGLNQDHLMKQICLNYDASFLFPYCEPTAPYRSQLSVDTVDAYDHALYPFLHPLERVTPNAVSSSQSKEALPIEMLEQTSSSSSSSTSSIRWENGHPSSPLPRSVKIKETSTAKRTKSHDERGSRTRLATFGKAVGRLVKKKTTKLIRTMTM